jgi:beta-barrel assembly-enhancing protease
MRPAVERFLKTSRPMARLRLRPFLAVLTVAALLAAAAPPLAAQQIGNRDLYEKSLKVAKEALGQYGAIDDPEALKRIDDIGYRVAQESHYTDFPFTFHLIGMSEPNAFALPAGQIFVTRGMLDLGLTDDMLAALLGHEAAHVVFGHFTSMQRRSNLMNVLSQALLVGVLIGARNDGTNSKTPAGPYRSPEPYTTGSDRVQGAAATSLIVSELLLRSFSREHEDQADEEGQRWAAAAGFSPTGAEELMALMMARIPQSKSYGYWRTHPFFDERVRSAKVRGKLLRQGEPRPSDDFRAKTQETLVAYLDQLKPAAETKTLVRDDALAAWPQGTTAERLRLDILHELREAELAHPSLERDYGKLVRAYAEQTTEVQALTPQSPFLATLAKESAELTGEAADLYPKAVSVLAGGLYETAFLERFLSNWPDAKEAPQAALSLGDARARLGDQTGSVESYLRAWETSPDSPEGARAAAGLRALAPSLTKLAALQQLALEERDPDLGRLATARLQEVAASFDDVDNGAEYLRRFPDGSQVAAVTDRLNSLADKLYAEVILYQAIGDNSKAVERINKILTCAPLSPAADLLRERAVVAS